MQSAGRSAKLPFFHRWENSEGRETTSGPSSSSVRLSHCEASPGSAGNLLYVGIDDSIPSGSQELPCSIEAGVEFRASAGSVSESETALAGRVN